MIDKFLFSLFKLIAKVRLYNLNNRIYYKTIVIRNK